MKKLNLVIGLVVMLGLSVVLGISVKKQENYRAELENIYQKSYFESMDSLSDVELKLSKLTIAEGEKTRKKLLLDIWRQCEIAESNLSQLSVKNQDMTSMIQFINKLGDYCYYLGMRSEVLTEKETKTMDFLYKTTVDLQRAFSSSQQKILSGQKFLGNNGLNFVGDSYLNFNESSIDYPEMIYDGPFSDGLNDRETKFLKDKEEVSSDDGIQKINAMFKDDIKNVKLLSTIGGGLESYLYEGEYNGKKSNITITKKGGYLVMLDSYREVNNINFDQNQGVKIAEEFVQSIGYNEMYPVWVTNSHSTVYVNFAYKNADIIYYPDIVKVKVELENGKIVGFEGQNFIYNHIERQLPTPQTIESAKAKVSKKLKVTHSALTLIPTETNQEKLCYEFSGEYQEAKYFVYIDAVTLEEIKVMRVIDSDEGSLIS